MNDFVRGTRGETLAARGSARVTTARSRLPVRLLVIALAATVGGCEVRVGAPSAPARAWGAVRLIETNNEGSAFAPQIGVDKSGNAMVVWYQSDGVRYNLWANRYTASSGWETATLIEQDDAGNVEATALAVDAHGNAMAVWIQSDGVRKTVRAVRYHAGSGWGAATRIETGSGDAADPAVALDAHGNAVAVWRQSDGTRDNVWSNRYTAAGWGTAQLIESDDTGNARAPRVAMDASGNGIAVWHQWDGTRFDIRSNRFVAGAGWQPDAITIESGTGSAVDPQIAIDPSGNALAVWAQSDGTRSNLVANRYTAGSGWGSAALIESDNLGNATEPHIAMDARGRAVAVWSQFDGSHTSTRANRYVPGAGWGTALVIARSDSGDVYAPKIAVNAGGDAMVACVHFDGTRDNVAAIGHAADKGWAQASYIDGGNNNAADPDVALDSGGDALVVWEAADGARTDIAARRFE